MCLLTSGIGRILSLALLALMPFSVNSQTASVAGGVVVTPSTPGFNPAGGAANNAYGVYEGLSKSASTGRVGYPSVPVANRSAMSKTASNSAMRGIWRAGGYAAAAVALVYAGGEFYNYLQCSTNQICKPGQGAVTDPAGSNPAGKYCADVSSWGQAQCGAFPKSACDTLGVDYTYKTDQYTYGYCYTVAFGGIKRIISRINGACADGYGWSGGACVSMAGTNPVPATDADLERAADAYRLAQPDRYLSDLKSKGVWAPDQNTMTAPQPVVSGVPVLRELPEDKPGAPAGNKTEKITPNTAAKPAADAQSVSVYNYNTTVVTHTDGSTTTESVAESPNLDIPDDYAREDTQQEIRDNTEEIKKRLDYDNLPELNDAPTFSESMQRLRTRINESPLGRAVEDAAEPDSGSHDGECPVGHFDYAGQSFAIDAHCQLVQSAGGIISGVMWACWVILALVVFLSA